MQNLEDEEKEKIETTKMIQNLLLFSRAERSDDVSERIVVKYCVDPASQPAQPACSCQILSTGFIAALSLFFFVCSLDPVRSCLLAFLLS